MADSKKYNGSTWEHSLRKLATATDTFTTLPVDVYADGNNATVGISGNTVQSDTPAPDNPIMPQGCGDLETVGAKAGQYKIPISSAGQTNNIYLGEVETTRKIKKLVLTGSNADGNTNITGQGIIYITPVSTLKSVENAYCTHYKYVNQNQGTSMPSNSFTTSGGAGTSLWFKTDYTSVADFRAYLAAQYAAGTPVTIWYVLAEPETAVVNEPLMKIGDYADEVSNVSIPTITGKGTFDVDTTLKPSGVSLNYTGWHDSSVKEWDGSEWQ